MMTVLCSCIRPAVTDLSGCKGLPVQNWLTDGPSDVYGLRGPWCLFADFSTDGARARVPEPMVVNHEQLQLGSMC